MKKMLSLFLLFSLLFTLNVNSIKRVEAAPSATKFKNCTELNKVYKGGVARSSKVKNKGGKLKYKATVNQKIYDLNKGLDRDKDLIACER